MSKTVKWSVSPRQKHGLIKIMGLIINMIQDHDVQHIYYIHNEERSLMSIHNELKAIYERETYTRTEREFLNEVRTLVLNYQRTNTKLKQSMPWDDPSYDNELTWAMNLNSMKLNSKGQIVNRF